MEVSAQQTNDVLGTLLCLIGTIIVFVLLQVVALLADLLNTGFGQDIRNLADEIAASGC